MGITAYKKKIYQKLKWLIFWRKFMLSIMRVRVTFAGTSITKIEPVYDDEIIEPPSLEMWTLYKNGESQPTGGLYTTKEQAIAMQEILNKILKSENKNKGPK